MISVKASEPAGSPSSARQTVKPVSGTRVAAAPSQPDAAKSADPPAATAVGSGTRKAPVAPGHPDGWGTSSATGRGPSAPRSPPGVTGALKRSKSVSGAASPAERRRGGATAAVAVSGSRTKRTPLALDAVTVARIPMHAGTDCAVQGKAAAGKAGGTSPRGAQASPSALAVQLEASPAAKNPGKASPMGTGGEPEVKAWRTMGSEEPAEPRCRKWPAVESASKRNTREKFAVEGAKSACHSQRRRAVGPGQVASQAVPAPSRSSVQPVPSHDQEVRSPVHAVWVWAVAARHGKTPAETPRTQVRNRRMPFATFVSPQRSFGRFKSVQTSTKQTRTFAK